MPLYIIVISKTTNFITFNNACKYSSFKSVISTQINVFHKKHKESNNAWNNLFDKMFPKYKTTERMLSHRYNTLVENKLHLDELDEQHVNEQQIRMFVQLDKKRPRVLTFGPDLEQLYHKYYWDFLI